MGRGSKRREQWREALAIELAKWEAKSYDQLVSELKEVCTYRVLLRDIRLQVEVEMIEKTIDYAHVMIGVNDGSIPWSFWPASTGFIRRRHDS